MTKTEEIVLNVLRELGQEEGKKELIEAKESTVLFGKNFDSMGIVLLTIEIEEQIYDALDAHITLADERAMSQKTSPFRSVKTLVKYVELLVDEVRND
jgi:acyl carrier protein